jgi:hypothetical protein
LNYSKSGVDLTGVEALYRPKTENGAQLSTFLMKNKVSRQNLGDFKGLGPTKLNKLAYLAKSNPPSTS